MCIKFANNTLTDYLSLIDTYILDICLKFVIAGSARLTARCEQSLPLQCLLRNVRTMASKYENNPAVANFVEYLRIPSVQPNVNYGKSLIKNIQFYYYKCFFFYIKFTQYYKTVDII